ncbi:two component, sigma54 specific, transcriptional regulator, Fis family [plant metagenome]
MNAYVDVLLVEDDTVLGGALRQRLLLEKFSVQWVESCGQAIELLRRTRLRPAFLLADIRLADGSGEQLYRQIIPYLAQTTVVFATAYGDIAQAVRLVSAGANDYLTKPYDTDALIARIRTAVSACTAVETATRNDENPFLLSPSTEKIAGAIERIAATPLHVLLEGETGVGKELSARYLHARSAYRDGPFVAVNCAEINESLAEVQWFGHDKGAFSGAGSAQQGLFGQAAGGTLFLDEIGQLPDRAQALLLRVLEGGFYRPLGAKEAQASTCRVIASTNTALQDAVTHGRFRSDLYYRLMAAHVVLPALRDRTDQIPALARGFLARCDVVGRQDVRQLTDDAQAAMAAYAWPGNVRELKNRLLRAALMRDEGALDVDDVFPDQKLDVIVAADLATLRDDAEWRGIQRAISESGGHLGLAAQRLGVSRTTLWKKLRKLNAHQAE